MEIVAVKSKMSKIPKTIRSQFGISEYNHLKGSLKEYNKLPILPGQLHGFTVFEGQTEELDAVIKKMPLRIQNMWKKLVSQTKEKPFVIISPSGEIAYYAFYIVGTTRYIPEIEKSITFEENEAYLCGSRTFPQYQGRGIAQYGRKWLFYKLKQRGIDQVHGVTDCRKPVTNYIHQKLGMKIIRKYKKYSIGSWRWVRVIPV